MAGGGFGGFRILTFLRGFRVFSEFCDIGFSGFLG